MEKFLIAGPCVIENRDMVMRLAELIKKLAKKLVFYIYLKLVLIKLIELHYQVFVVPELMRA